MFNKSQDNLYRLKYSNFKTDAALWFVLLSLFIPEEEYKSPTGHYFIQHLRQCKNGNLSEVPSHLSSQPYVIPPPSLTLASQLCRTKEILQKPVNPMESCCSFFGWLVFWGSLSWTVPPKCWQLLDSTQGSVSKGQVKMKTDNSSLL